MKRIVYLDNGKIRRVPNEIRDPLKIEKVKIKKEKKQIKKYKKLKMNIPNVISKWKNTKSEIIPFERRIESNQRINEYFEFNLEELKK
jgi:hypothetical protein